MPSSKETVTFFPPEFLIKILMLESILESLSRMFNISKKDDAVQTFVANVITVTITGIFKNSESILEEVKKDPTYIRKIDDKTVLKIIDTTKENWVRLTQANNDR